MPRHPWLAVLLSGRRGGGGRCVTKGKEIFTEENSSSHLGHASSLKSGASGAGQPEMAIFNARRPSRDSQKIESDQCLADRDCAFSTFRNSSNAIKRA